MIAVVIAGLAGWRVASLFVHEDGPFGMFEHVRALAGVPKVGILAPRPLVGGILSCVWCASMYTSAASLICWEYLARGPVAILAASAVAVGAETVARRVK